MSEPYQIASLNPAGIVASLGVLAVHTTLLQADISLDEDSMLLLNDAENEDPEPEPAGNAKVALARITGWPTLGSIDYAGVEGTVTVSYLTEDLGGRLNCVLISAQQRAVDNTHSLPRYRQLALDVHRAFHASRTILDWGLVARGFDWRAELVRLRQHQFEGGFEGADFRPGD